MRRLSLLLLIGTLAGCTSASVGCGACTVTMPAAAELRSILHGEQLRSQLHEVLTALAACDVASPALAEAGLEDPHQSGQQPVTRAMQCLRVVRVTAETPSLVAFDLAPQRVDGSAGAAEFVMFASYDGQRWRFTWPAGLGPPQITDAFPGDRP